MLDSKTSCLLRGIVGVIFGLLALLLPNALRSAFYYFFWALIVLGMVFFVFLAITGRGEESMLWFGMAAALLVAGLLSIMFAELVEYLFILLIAAIAIYNGFTDITYALEHPKTKFILIPGMIITAIVVLVILLYYFPALFVQLFLSVLGTFALVFGVFSLALGFSGTDAPAAGA